MAASSPIRSSDIKRKRTTIIMKLYARLFCLFLSLSALPTPAVPSAGAHAPSAHGFVAQDGAARPTLSEDVHSYSNPHQVRVRHVSLDLTAGFGGKVLAGS